MVIVEKIKHKDRRTIKLFGITVLRYRRNHKKQNILLPYDIFNIDELAAKGTKFPHLVGIVISRNASIGNNCVIYQNVTIGTKSYENTDPSNYPCLGDNVIVYAGAVIVGNVKIGNNAVIAANSVVISDVPENALYAGSPARLIKYIKKC